MLFRSTYSGPFARPIEASPASSSLQPSFPLRLVQSITVPSVRPAVALVPDSYQTRFVGSGWPKLDQAVSTHLARFWGAYYNQHHFIPLLPPVDQPTFLAQPNTRWVQANDAGSIAARPLCQRATGVKDPWRLALDFPTIDLPVYPISSTFKFTRQQRCGILPTKSRPSITFKTPTLVGLSAAP